jgi:hypothetical protein
MISAPATFPVAEYQDYRARVGDERQLWENSGWSIRGRDGDRDYLCWASPYFVQGVPGASYRPGRFAVDQSILITTPADGPDGLHDNDFLAVGWDAQDQLRWDDVDVVHDDGSLTWRTPDREFQVSPEAYVIRGSRAGIRTDLTMTLDAPPLWFTDPAEGFDVRANRWWIGSGTADGTILAPGAQIRVAGAHAVHERHIHLGLAHDPVRLLAGGGVCWYTASGEDLHLALLARPTLGSAWAQITLGEQTWNLTEESLSVRTLDTWLDPQTSMLVAESWAVTAELPGGIAIELELMARARAYHTWDFPAQGQTMIYWWLNTGHATIRDGRTTRRIDDIAAEAHLNRTFSTRHAGVRSA